MAPTKPTRRQVLATAGTGALAATAGVFYGSGRAEAVSIDVTNLTIPEQTASSPTAPASVLLRLTGEWQIDANVVPDELRLTPRAKVESSPQGWTPFETETIVLNAADASGQVDLERNLLKLMALRDLFPQSAGETATRTVAVELQAEVTKDGSVIGSDSATTTFKLTLGHTEAHASVGFEVHGDVVLE